MTVDMNDDNWTYGAEHELADWDTRRGLPAGFGRDRKDITIVNSNGIAADPKDKLYHRGGEICTPPTHTPEEQGFCLHRITEMHPDATVNYRSNLHVHVRVPGLKDDLLALKRVQVYNHVFLSMVLPILEPIPEPKKLEYSDPEAFLGAKRRYQRRRVSHQTILPKARLLRQLDASTTKEFFGAEPPTDKAGKPMWHFQPRCCVNLRQLMQTDTVEFRHFPGTLRPSQVNAAVRWCRDYLYYALEDLKDVPIIPQGLPKFCRYEHELEKRFLRTVREKNKVADIKRNIREILDEDARTVPR